jgi:hypothetical protein
VTLITDTRIVRRNLKSKETTMTRDLVLLATALVIAIYLTLAVSPEVTMTTQPKQAVTEIPK